MHFLDIGPILTFLALEVVVSMEQGVGYALEDSPMRSLEHFRRVIHLFCCTRATHVSWMTLHASRLLILMDQSCLEEFIELISLLGGTLELLGLSSSSFGGDILFLRRLYTCGITSSFVYVSFDLVLIS